MKTADFLPPKAFLDHIERRRTPRRVLILGVFSMLCLGAASAVELEAQSQAQKALVAETPDDNAQRAKLELQELFDHMTREAVRLDPLTEHITLPQVGEILAGLAGAVGRGTQIEKVTWVNEIKQGKKNKFVGITNLTITCKVRGDEMLLALPGRLQDLTGFAESKASRVELVKGSKDLIRVDVALTNPMTVPAALVGKEKGR